MKHKYLLFVFVRLEQVIFITTRVYWSLLKYSIVVFFVFKLACTRMCIGFVFS